LSEGRKYDKKIGVFQSHRHFWNNSPGTILRVERVFDLDPLRRHIYDENIKGEFTPEMLDVEKLIDDITRAYQDRPLLNDDVFQCISFAGVVPWLEAIIGCHLYSLGRGGSMVANPADIEPGDLPQHLRYLLDNLDENVWFKKLSDGYQALAEILGAKFPLTHTLMLGPGDMVGALLGHENFIGRMLKPADNKDFLNELLDLCAKIYIKTAKMQLEHTKGFKGGYCNGWGLWAPGLNIRAQEDEAAFVSPKLYNEFLLPYHVQEVDAFDYSTFHMHSGYVRSIYDWRDFSKKSSIKAFQVSLDPSGPAVEDLMETLLEINSEKPLIIGGPTDEQAKAVEKHIGDFPGSVLHRKSTSTRQFFYKGPNA
jgi:hypothetical protein